LPSKVATEFVVCRGLALIQQSAYRLLYCSVRKQGRGDAMTKSGLILTLCFFLACGCSLFDSPEMTSEQPAVAASVVENEYTKVVMPVQAVPEDVKVPPARSLTRDEIRTMQLRLREVGLDPGPVDGVAGAKTQTAFARFQSGCSKLKPLMENAPEVATQNLAVSQAVNNVARRQETQAIQTQVRDAGFNPGPLDGIFGNKTRSVLARLKADCPTVNEFAGILNNPLSPSSKPAPPARTLETNSAKLQSLSTTGAVTLLPHGLRKIFAFFNCGYEMPALIQGHSTG
jgi:peptidoglycan hydrolase-like protein with peptidoglycan-binding domain